MISSDRSPGMSMIVQTVARWLKGLILLFGIYIVVYGHMTPGGGFGGGVIIASAFILVTLAAGEATGLGLFGKPAASRLDSVGLLAFLLIAWLGTWLGSHFFENFLTTPAAAHFTLLSGGTMPLSNIALGLKVASALFLVFSVLAALHVATARLGQAGSSATEATPAPASASASAEGPGGEDAS